MIQSLWNIDKGKNKQVIEYIERLSPPIGLSDTAAKVFNAKKQEALRRGLEANERLELIGYRGATRGGHKTPDICIENSGNERRGKKERGAE